MCSVLSFVFRACVVNTVLAGRGNVLGCTVGSFDKGSSCLQDVRSFTYNVVRRIYNGDGILPLASFTGDNNGV